jgi:DNA-binding NtrC family response regulator
VLETRAVQRLGESKARNVDVRLVASTNKNLDEEVRAGRFRQDLYFRLSVICVRLPPLRDRREEIPRLLRHFVSKLAPDEPPDLPAPLIALAKSYDWPGNVRELRNLAERLVTLKGAALETLLPHDAARPTQPRRVIAEAESPFHEAKQRMIDDFEATYLRSMLERHGGNISEVARVAAISRQSCYRLMKKHGLVDEESD